MTARAITPAKRVIATPTELTRRIEVVITPGPVNIGVATITQATSVDARLCQAEAENDLDRHEDEDQTTGYPECIDADAENPQQIGSDEGEDDKEDGSDDNSAIGGALLLLVI